jgi:hypothetical protein
MKKEVRIGIVLLSIFGALYTTARSFALVTKGANDASFGISQAKTYYLKGSFNDWGASFDYILQDMTATMGEEEGKVAEFTITKAIEKDATLKIWDSNNNWYEQGVNNCSYADKWGRTTETSANYVVPMTATYNIYLKFYENGSSQIYLTAPDLTKLYFKPSTNWLTDGARFAAYFFNDEDNVWDDLTKNGDFYEVNIPSGYSKVIFCRMDPGTTENNWTNKWNQTGNLNIDYRSIYEIPSEGWNDFGNEYWRAI